MDTVYKLLFICPLLFLAGIIDGIAGGGGIIALPTYLMSGIPVHFAYGCNKMQSCLGTFSSLIKYMKSGYVDIKASLISAVSAIIGSFVSTRIVLMLSDNTMKIIIAIAMCFIIALTFFTHQVKTKKLLKTELDAKNIIIFLALGLILGLYDGFFGPGCGTVALMLFTAIFHYDVRTSAGNGKVIIVISNLIALINYIVQKSIIYEIAIPATFSNMLGCYLGAKLAVKSGQKLVKKLVPVVAVILIIQAILKII